MYKTVRQFIKENELAAINQKDIEDLKARVQKYINIDISKWEYKIIDLDCMFKDDIVIFTNKINQSQRLVISYIVDEDCIRISQDNESIADIKEDMSVAIHEVKKWAKNNIDNSNRNWVPGELVKLENLGGYIQDWYDTTYSKHLVVYYDHIFRRVRVRTDIKERDILSLIMQAYIKLTAM